MRRRPVAAVVVALLLTLAGCGGAPSPDVASAAGGPQYDPQPYENLRDGGTLTVGVK